MLDIPQIGIEYNVWALKRLKVTNSLAHSLACSLTQLLAHSLTWTHSPTPSLTPSFTHSLTLTACVLYWKGLNAKMTVNKRLCFRTFVKMSVMVILSHHTWTIQRWNTSQRHNHSFELMCILLIHSIQAHSDGLMQVRPLSHIIPTISQQTN